MINLSKTLKDALDQPLPGSAAQEIMAPTVRFTGHEKPDSSKARNSSVFILLYQKNNNWYIPFIKRQEYKGVHSGQVSFPGGKVELSDTSLLDTAYRETEEEIGIKGSDIKFLGSLSTMYIPNSNFLVYPKVGIITNNPTFTINTYEVDHIIEAPLFDILNPTTRKTFTKKVNGIEIEAPYFSICNQRIWGATAMMLSEFIQVLIHHEISVIK